MKYLSSAFLMAIALLSALAASAAEPWDKTFPKSESVAIHKVAFYNRLGINLVGDLYLPLNADLNEKYPAIIVGTPLWRGKRTNLGALRTNYGRARFS